MTDAQRQRAFQKAIAQQLREQGALVKQTRESLLAILTTISEQITVLLAAQPSDYQQWFLPQINAQIKTVLQGLQRQGETILDVALNDASAAGLAQLDNALRPAGVLLGGVAPAINMQLLTNIKAFHVNRIADITTRTASAIEIELSKVLIGAQSPYDATKAIQAIMGDAPRYRIKTIVNTSMSSVYNKSAADRYAQASEYLPGLKKQWHRSGKRDPRLSHYAAHLQAVPTNEPFNIGGVSMMQPHDLTAPAKETINCGCYMQPLMENWDVKLPAQKLTTAA